MRNIEEYFKGLADSTRLRIMNLLLGEELCGRDIEQLLGIPQSNISRHLTYLKRAGLVADRREGCRVHYRVLDNGSLEYQALVAYLQAVMQHKVFLADHKRLSQAMKSNLARREQ